MFFVAASMIFACITASVAAIALPSTAFAISPFLVPAKGSTNLTPFLEILEDASGALTLEQALTSTEFKPAGNEIPTIGYTKSVW